MSRIGWCKDAPLAATSLALHQLALWGIGRAMRRPRSLGEPAGWRFLDEGLLRPDSMLTALSVRAPRWNPHAVVALSPVLQVRGELRVRVETLRASTPRWTVACYDLDGLRATLGPSTTRPGRAWETLKLPSGIYRLVLRIYDPGPGSDLPAVCVDGQQALAARPIPPGTNQVYQGLRARARRRHRALQFHVRPMLRLGTLVGEKRVARAFLPVGNPHTAYRFGTIERGQRLRVRPTHASPEGCALYLCLYDRASFPMWFDRVPPQGVETPPADDDGTWLVRVVAGSIPAPSPASLEIHTIQPAEGLSHAPA
jgi:hypothetical protein